MSNGGRIRVLLVDDQTLVRDGIRMLLKRKPDIEVVGQAADGAEALTRVAVLDPDVVLMDIRMPGMDGVEATQQLRANGSRAAVIILTTFHEDEYVVRALQAGARGYLLKDVDHRILADAIRTVHAGHGLIQPEVTGAVLRELARSTAGALPAPAPPAPPQPSPRLELLSARELAILRLLGMGHSNQEISHQLAISIGTVKNHISSILAKLDVRDRTQAALLAQEAGLHQLP